MNEIRFEQVSVTDSNFSFLCSELDCYLDEAIGGKENREKYLKYNGIDTLDYVLLAYDDHIPVGCAALRKYSDSQIELKRVFVQSEYRRQNIGGMLLEQLILWAIHSHYRYILLETGEFLTDSVKLYKRYGFIKIENYGNYVGISESLCMGLSLTTAISIFSEKKHL